MNSDNGLTGRAAYWMRRKAPAIVGFCAMAVFWAFVGYVVTVTFGGFQ